MIIKMIVGALFFLMTLLLGKEAERKEADKREKNRQ